MQARHNSRDLSYREPFGALELGQELRLSIDVWDADIAFCELRLWSDERGETLISMERDIERGPNDCSRFTVRFTPNETGLIWYSFRITTSAGETWRYGTKEGKSGGEGAFAYGEPPSFQITVYEKRSEEPSWWKNAVCYQIFPDRFSRGEDFATRAETLKAKRKGPKRALVKDWNTAPSYLRDAKGGIKQWDFYGGTLEGIREKLDYLEELGVDCIYLNPIFEAASNHRYDTADYLNIDPLLGDTESFTSLCDEAHSRGMSIILDGVFNHTGCDSRYFNRYGNYPELGAYQSSDSPYRDWYFLNEDGTYTSWWGVADLPDIDEMNPDFQDFICGENGVVRSWLRAGADGWRLDVADELPDEFIVRIKEAVVAEKPDGLLIGEVWEDASNKRAYDKLRNYFMGEELDGVMNYPLRSGVLGFLTGELTAEELCETLSQLHENYPPSALAQSMSLLGSHDRERLFTVLGGVPNADSLKDEERAAFKLSDDERALAKSRLWLATLLQMCLPGVPCIYYGDEAGLEGYRDPYNRATFPWDGGDKDCYTIYRNAIGLRKTLPALQEGNFKPFALGDDVFGFWRETENEKLCVLVNASRQQAHTVRLPRAGAVVEDVISGRSPKLDGDEVELTLWPLGSALLNFHVEELMQEELSRGVGVLAHITSLPNDEGAGRLGKVSRDFVDMLASSHVRYWQTLPWNPCDAYGSPYAGLSAFAGNPALLERPLGKDWKSIYKSKELKAFLEREQDWLYPYAAFRAIKAKLGESPWWEWKAPYRSWGHELLKRRELKAGIEQAIVEQYLFAQEAHALRDYAHERGVYLIGDMPMYVSADSSDVWAAPELFALNEDGTPALVAGAPPDGLAADGQVWGNPCYVWDAHEKSGFAWWLRRFEKAFELFDYVRLDHFLGFSSYFAIPAGEGADKGTWRFGPGKKLFEAATARFGKLPLIAEDLGSVTPAVRALLAETGIPGMSVIQFLDQDVREGMNFPVHNLVYSSTHDTDTLVGWLMESYELKLAEARVLAGELIEQMLASKNSLVMLALQDVCGLGSDARMNVPGVAEGNWTWQVERDACKRGLEQLASIVEAAER